MATFQDLGFVIDEADETLGTIRATKLDRYALRMTITVRPFGEKQLVVRANARNITSRPLRTRGRISSFLLLLKRQCS